MEQNRGATSGCGSWQRFRGASSWCTSIIRNRSRGERSEQPRFAERRGPCARKVPGQNGRVPTNCRRCRSRKSARLGGTSRENWLDRNVPLLQGKGQEARSVITGGREPGQGHQEKAWEQLQLKISNPETQDPVFVPVSLAANLMTFILRSVPFVSASGCFCRPRGSGLGFTAIQFYVLAQSPDLMADQLKTPNA